MNIAQALRKHRALRNTISTLKDRVASNLMVLDGENKYSDQDYNNTLEKLTETCTKATKLKNAIGKANNKEVNGESVASLLVTRQEISDKLAFYNGLRNLANADDRWSDKAKKTSRIPLNTLDKQIDDLIEELRLTDESICNLNAQIQVEFQ